MLRHNNNNYFIKLKTMDWLHQTCLLKPHKRDILMTLVCRRSILANVGLELDDVELNAIRKQFYRGLRKEAFEKHLKPMIDQRLIIKQKDLNSERYTYTTIFNEIIEADLSRRQEAKMKREDKKLAGSMPTGTVNRSNIRRGLKDLSESLKIDTDTDLYK